MNVLVPFFFTLLSIVWGDDGNFDVNVVANHDIVYTEAISADTLTISETEPVVVACVYDAVGQIGSRRYMVTFDADSRPVDVTDLGKQRDTGFPDDLYITDKQRNTLTGVFTVEVSDYDLSPSPEGGYTIEQTDKIVAKVINHDNNESTDYVLRHTTIVKHIDKEGHIRLQSIRPTTDDAEAFVREYCVYLLDTEDADTIMDAANLRAFLAASFPIPR